MADIDNRSA